VTGKTQSMRDADAAARASARRPGPADLYILGAGVAFPEHLTLQTLDVLAACRRICSNLPQAELDRLPEELRRKCTSLWPLYHEHRERSDNYEDVAQAVLDATAREPPVAWLTPGHPLIFDSVSQALLREGQARGLSVQVGAAISCIDTILAQLGYDPADGLLIYDATSLVMRRLPPAPAFAALLFQPSAFGSSVTHYTSRWTPDLSPLRDHLRGFYPAEHPCAFVRSDSPQGGAGQVSWWRLDDIVAAPFEVIAGTTMFMPALAGTG
jgi:hypothetical protein